MNRVSPSQQRTSRAGLAQPWFPAVVYGVTVFTVLLVLASMAFLVTGLDEASDPGMGFAFVLGMAAAYLAVSGALLLAVDLIATGVGRWVTGVRVVNSVLSILLWLPPGVVLVGLLFFSDS